MKKAVFTRKNVLLIPALLWAAILFGQADSAVAIVRYSFSHLRDTTDPTDVYTEKMVLFIGKQQSAYQSYDRILAQEHIRKTVEAMKKMTPEEMRLTKVVAPANIKMGSFEYFYKNSVAGTLRCMSDFYWNQSFSEEPLPVISWKVQTETRTIGGFRCQLATGYFKGRNYEAWFCPQLPYADGPWKLNGLPGLILEACDAKKQIVFAFEGFEGSVAQPTPIEMDKRARPASVKDMKRLLETYEKNMAAFAASAAGGQGTLQSSGGASTPREKKKIINNPIELVD